MRVILWVRNAYPHTPTSNFPPERKKKTTWKPTTKQSKTWLMWKAVVTHSSSSPLQGTRCACTTASWVPHGTKSSLLTLFCWQLLQHADDLAGGFICVYRVRWGEEKLFPSLKNVELEELFLYWLLLGLLLLFAKQGVMSQSGLVVYWPLFSFYHV